MKYLHKNFIYLKEITHTTRYRLSKEAGVRPGIIQTLLDKEDLSNIPLGTLHKLSTYFKVNIDDLVNKDLSMEDVESKEK